MRHVEPLVSRFGNAVLGGALRVATEREDDGAIRVLAPIFEVEIGELASPSSHRLDGIAVRFRQQAHRWPPPTTSSAPCGRNGSS